MAGSISKYGRLTKIERRTILKDLPWSVEYLLIFETMFTSFFLYAHYIIINVSTYLIVVDSGEILMILLMVEFL